MEKIKKDKWAYVSGARLISTKYAKSAEEALSLGNHQEAVKNYEEAAKVITEMEAEMDDKKISFPGLIDSGLKVNKAIYLSKAANLKKKLGGKERGLLKRLGFIFSLFIVSIFFLSSNITGNVIGNLNSTTSNSVGAIFLVVGIVSTLLCFRKKNAKTLKK